MPSRAVLALVPLLAACRPEAASAAPGWRPAAPPQRVVAGSVLAAEVLLAILPRERLAAVHSIAADARYSLVAAAAKGLPQVGAEPEQLLAVNPDLVITDPFTRPETQLLLEAAGVPIVRTAEPRSFADIDANVRRLASVCHAEAAGETLVAAMAADLAALRGGAEAVAAWRIMSLDGALHTYGRGSLFDAVCAAAGARNAAAEHGVGPFRKLDVEAVMAWRPDALVLSAGAEAGAVAREREWLHQHPGLRLLPCVQRGRLVFVPGPLLAATSPRLVEAAAAIQRQLLAWGRP